MKFREGNITYDQLLARVEYKRFGTKYQVLDDLRGKIQDNFIDPGPDDAVIDKAMEFAKDRGLKESELTFLAGKQCIRSIFKKPDASELAFLNGNRSLD